MKPTSKLDISNISKMVVSRAIPDSPRMIFLKALIVSSPYSSLIAIEVRHAAQADLRLEVGAKKLLRLRQARIGACADVHIDRANLAFRITARDVDLVGRDAVVKVVSELQIFEGLAHRLPSVEIDPANEPHVQGIRDVIEVIGDHGDARNRRRRIGSV